ncbi:cyclin-dependent kinases regulatory subunit [Pelomyxa schiedti]|nr:cyclin-dependent kinases regulatory subunit [Pelomyxa schiedti]
MPIEDIQYSDKYYDDVYEYRHVTLPPDISRLLPKDRLLSEAEWRAVGVQQSLGWVHYLVHKPEPHILLFRRPRTDLPPSGSTTTQHY